MNRFVAFYTYDKDRKFVPHPGVPDLLEAAGAAVGRRRSGLDRDATTCASARCC